MEINVAQRKNWDIKSGNTVKVWQKIKGGGQIQAPGF